MVNMVQEQITVTDTGDASLDLLIEFGIVGDVLEKMLAIQLEDYNLLPLEYVVMFRLMMRGGSMRPTDMSLDLFRAKPLISAAISELEDKGLVKRTLNKSDLRSFQINLTKKGANMIEKIMQPRKELAHKCMSIFTPEQIEQMKQNVVAFRKHIINVQIKGESLTEIQKT